MNARRIFGCILFALLLKPQVLAQQTLPARIYCVDLSQLSVDEQLLTLTLQGLVAKREPAIWVKTDGLNALLLDELRDEGVDIVAVNSAWRLVTEFREHIEGYVLCELDSDSVNVATSLCGPYRSIALTPKWVDRAKDLGIVQREDAREMTELDTLARHGHRFSRSTVVVQKEKLSSHLRDWAVFQNAYCFYGLPREQRRKAVATIGDAVTVYGWEGEQAFVRDVSRVGGSVVPADYSRNLSSLAKLPVEVPNPPRQRPEKVSNGQRIVAFVMSDGDNIQWMGGGFATHRGFWQSPHRGQFSMTWEMAPVLSEIAPRAMRYFYRTASRGDTLDGFVTGPSGAGYIFHHDHPRHQAFADRTGALMKRSHLRIVTVLNAGGSMEDSRELLEQPDVMGALYKGWIYDSEQGKIWWHQGKPCVSYRYLLWEPTFKKSPDGVAQAISQLPADPENDPQSYALINVHAWSFRSMGGPMEAVAECIGKLPPKSRVVTAEQLVYLLRENFGQPVPDTKEYLAK